MSVVVADTAPLNYLLLIDQIVLLAMLFERVIAPAAVRSEMLDANTPNSVRQWAAAPPSWFEVLPDPLFEPEDVSLADLDRGEQAAAQLAINLKATLVLMDDRAGVTIARRKGLLVTGTLGILDMAAFRGLVDIEDCIERLKLTNFRYSQPLIEQLLVPYRTKK